MTIAQELMITVRPRPELSKNRIKALHHQTAARYTRQAREDAHMLALEAIQERKPPGWTLPLHRASIVVSQYYANRPLDFDGLAMKAAPSIDGLVDAGVIVDDSPNCISAYYLEHFKVEKRVENRIEITVLRGGKPPGLVLNSSVLNSSRKKGTPKWE